ncbi:MAG: ATP-binding protein [Brevundimonas sp.]|nr:ATP-binding protein [Brevundimonas sp.]
MVTADYALVAQIRFRELKTRVALAGFIGATAWVITPSLWPLGWIAAVLVSQVVDWAVFRPLRQTPDMVVSRAYEVICCLTAALTVVVYSAMAAHLWFNGGEAGRLFAMIQVSGGLLHVCLHMYHARALLLSAAGAHALYFLGLPVIEAVLTRSFAPLLLAVGCILYLTHLVVAVRQNLATTKALKAANREAMEQGQRAEIASAAKSDFLAVISHEIRTPMNAVISAANLLRRTRLDPRQREHVSMLMDAGDVLLGLLNDVLDFSKIEAGKMQLEVADIDVRDRLRSLVRLWEQRAMANGVRLRLDIPATIPEAVRTDPLRFQQILFNLMSNAVKFTEAGEVVVTAGWNPASSRLSVEVRDTGVGIPAHRMDQVFNSFEQADAGTTRRFGGTGLGLAISRRLAQLMGGDLSVQSVVGQGSTFRLDLPVEVAVDAAPQPERQTMVPLSLMGRSILAADDHEVNRRILALLLEPHGCRLTLVENGAEAVEAAELERFDAVLMDMQMPVMDGLEASRRIRLGGLNTDTPLIALTANAMDVHRAAWDAAGVHAFLTKPIDPTLLAQTLAEACALPREGVVQAVA